MKTLLKSLPALALALSAVLTGCAGGGSPSASISVPAVALPYGSNGSIVVTVNYSGGSAPGGITALVNGSAVGIGSISCSNGSPETCTIAYNTGTLSAGTYVVSASVVTTTYGTISGTGQLTIIPAQVASMTAANASVAYGGTTTLTSATTFGTGNAPTGAVTFKVNGATTGVGTTTCTVTGNVRTCTAPYAGTLTPGTYAIAAAQAADQNYQAASATGTLTVTQGSTTTSASGVTAAQGSSSTTLTASVAYTGAVAPTGAASFTVNGSATGVGTASCTGSASPLTCTATYNPSSLNAGSYTIVFTQAADTNYTATTATGSLTIPQLTPTVTVASASGKSNASVSLSATVAYTGPKAPTGAFSFTVNGSATGVGTATCTGTSSPLTCTASYSTGSLTAGGYTIAGSIAADVNYLTASGTNTLTISSASATVTTTSPSITTAMTTAPLSASIAYTAAKPTGAVTFTVNGSSTGVGTVSCTGSSSPLTCTATYTVGTLTQGTYAIVATLAADSNYSASSGNGTLTITLIPGISVGNVAMANAHVHLLAAATSGYGAASVSVLTAGQTGQSDAGGPYVTADANGYFTLPAGASCTTGQQMYFYANGGTINSGTNSAAVILGPAGACTSTGTIPTYSKFMNEVTTVATAYALAGFATDPLHVADDEGVVSNQTAAIAKAGMANAFANIGNLVSAGAALQTTPAGNGGVPQDGINMIANLLAACDVSSGPASAACQRLFNNILSAGATGTTATDTATVAINLAHNPYPGATQVSNLWGGNGPTQVFTPSNGSMPNDFTLCIIYNSTSMQGASNAVVNPLVVDQTGNVWFSNYQKNSISKFSPLGADISTANTGFTGGGTISYPNGLAVDTTGNLWIASVGNGGTIVELSPSGSLLTPATGGYEVPNGVFNLTFDPNGVLWIINSSSIDKMLISPVPGINAQQLSSTVRNSNGFASDANGNLWFTNNSSSNVGEFNNAGTLLSGTTGFTAPLYNQPFWVAIDANGNAWVACYSWYTFKFTPAGVGTTVAQGVGGVNVTYGIAVDGNNKIWTSGRNGNVAELNNDGTPVSPTTTTGNGGNIGGYQGAGGNTLTNLAPEFVAVDQSGNVWAYGANNGNVGVLIGAATPVVAPLSVGLKYGKLGQRP